MLVAIPTSPMSLTFYVNLLAREEMSRKIGIFYPGSYPSFPFMSQSLSVFSQFLPRKNSLNTTVLYITIGFLFETKKENLKTLICFHENPQIGSVWEFGQTPSLIFHLLGLSRDMAFVRANRATDPTHPTKKPWQILSDLFTPI